MKTFITQILVISSLSMAYARAQGGERPQMSGEMKAAFAACHEEAGMPERKSGERPTKEQREAMKTCLQGKGFTPPEHGGKGCGHSGVPPEQTGETEAGEE